MVPARRERCFLASATTRTSRGCASESKTTELDWVGLRLGGYQFEVDVATETGVSLVALAYGYGYGYYESGVRLYDGDMSGAAGTEEAGRSVCLRMAFTSSE